MAAAVCAVLWLWVGLVQRSGAQSPPWYPYPATYTAGSDWVQACYTGTAQSPIDFEACQTPTTRTEIGITWNTSMPLLVKNDGKTIKLSNDGLDVPGGMTAGGMSYTFVQCHFHWGSEHTVSYDQYPFEVHCVHTRDDASGRYGVFGVFYTLGNADPFLQTLIDGGLPVFPASGESTNVSLSSVDVNMLYGSVDRTKYWDYQGSFTTPGCDELVDFYIMMEPLTMSQAQLDAFKTEIGWAAEGGNFRPAQPLNGRTVGGCTTKAPMYPYPYADNGPNAWNSLCYTGQAQSPISFTECAPYKRDNRAPVQFTWVEQNTTLVNTGYALQLNFPSAAPGKMMVQNKTYTLVQCHFHWSSEHRVNNVMFPMEVHCVHSEDGGTGRYGVFGVFYELGDGDDEDPFLATLMAGTLPAAPGRRLAASSSSTSGFSGVVDMKRLYGSLDLTQYFDYQGSFTTPPCTEAVDFYIMMRPLKMSQAQLAAFQEAIGWKTAGGNYRPPQPLNGRVVRGCGESLNWYPYPERDAPNAWDALCYDGLKQSPVDFPSCAMYQRNNRPAVQVTWQNQAVVLKNTENAVQLDAAGATTGKMMVGSKSYTLVQCHWHWGSEHFVGGHQYPLEVHCVHSLDGSNPLSYGVFGMFYEVGAENAFLSQFITQLPLSPYRRLAGAAADTTISSFVGPLDFTGLYGDLDLSQFYNYEGSFTTPPCTEAVEFYIMMNPQTLSQPQLDAFKEAIGWTTAMGNFRPPQPLNGREIGGCSVGDGGNWYPYPTSPSAPNAWDALCYSGTAQSPINFEACSTPETRTAISLAWNNTQAVSLENVGSSVKLVADASGPPGKMTAGGKTYTLVQCHFHWGSEHFVGYDQYPLEVHCVHSEDGGTGRYGVFGVFYTVGAENSGLAQFIGSLPQLPGRRLASGATTSSWTGPMDFGALASGVDLTRYWSYQGSFTTPPCSELVDFYIMVDPVTLSQAQLTAMKDAMGWKSAGGNFRPPQPLNGRQVSGCTTEAKWYPYPTSDSAVNPWPELCYTGQAQSPIDFAACPSYQQSNRAPVQLSWEAQAITLKNNEHTIVLHADGESPGKMKVQGKNYTLVQCHFHWGAEHFVAGTQHPFEVHCVHSEDDSSPQRYGVFGVFYQLGAEDPFLQTLINAPLPTAGVTSAFTGPVDLSMLHSNVDRTRYYDYQGSFTTPPCTEAVDFYIMMEPITLSQAQLDAFKTAIGWQSAGGNFRPPQNLNGRTVGGCSATANWYPYPTSQNSPNAWDALCYTGQAQSPINFDTCATYQIENRAPVRITWEEQPAQLINNGHTVQLNAMGSETGKMMVQGKTYTLVQCHFHWGAEHFIGGAQHPFEVHCVHSEDGTGRYGVFGVFYQLGAADPFLAKLLNGGVPSSPNRRLASRYTSGFSGSLELKEMYGDVDLTKYWSYQGSFTTPPCSELVDFYIMMEPLTISQAQLDSFKSAIGWQAAGGNFRPPQPLNGRNVSGCRTGTDMNWYPYPASTAPNAWDALCYSGTKQSPVNFDTCAPASLNNRPAIQITWANQTTVLKNTGDAVVMDATGASTGKMMVQGRTYTLVQCHWHWGSEHTVGNYQYPLEVHCVHTKDGSNPLSYGVFGFFYELGEENDFLEHFLDNLPMSPYRRLAGAASDTSISSFAGPVDFKALYGDIDLTTYYDYEGSFTTPPCTEAVEFYIMMGAQTLSEAQLNAFKRAIGWAEAGGNFRPPQPLLGRQVGGCTATGNWYPYPTSQDAPNAWDALCYTGQAQSPVAFDSCSTPESRTAIEITWTAAQTVVLSNTGYSVKLAADAGNPGKMVAGGKTYTLVQCHFHWGSEHTVGYDQYPLEVHCVHSEDGTSRFGVFGVFYEVGAENAALQQFIADLPQLPGRRLATGDTVSAWSGPMDFRSLYGNIDLTKYWSYQGSFTTPPCTEAVDFYIMMEPVTLSQAQLDLMRAAQGWSGAGGNFRPPQPLNGRTVSGCSATPPVYPYPPVDTGANAWPSICYTGTEQSPIDFATCPYYRRANREKIHISWVPQSITLINTGKAVQLTAGATMPGKMTVDGKNFTLVQCHFHYGSEHFVAGTQHPFEVHCVHSEDNSSPQRYGVFGLFYELGDPDPFLDTLIAGTLPPSPNSVTRRLASSVTTSSFTGPVDLTRLYHNVDLTKYYDYRGSFTTPPCTEAVTFYIMMQTLTISSAQLESFKTAIGWRSVGGNFRPPQPLNGRQVGGCNADPNWYPYGSQSSSNAWSSLCYTGVKQSPIDFDACPTYQRQNRYPVQLTWTNQTVVLKHTENAVQLDATSASPGKMMVRDKVYTLVQCHWHWGSEHTVDGRQYPLEVHCVHVKDGSNPTTYGVFGFFYELGEENQFLKHFIHDLPMSPGRLLAGDAAEITTSSYVGPVNFMELYDKDVTTYYNYEGSFTTPPCTEAVEFYIMMQPATVSEAQLEAFKVAIGWPNAGGNFRPPQPLNGREVNGCGARGNWYPVPESSSAPNAWPALCYSGTAQSPIDLPLCVVADTRTALQLAWQTDMNVGLSNNGYTVQLDAPSTTGKMTVNSQTYTLRECHFHYGSEHTIGRERMVFEVECVHSADDSSGRSAVFVILYTLGAANAFLDQLVGSLPFSPDRRLSTGRQLADPTVVTTPGPVNLNGLYSGIDLTKYLSYAGSKTTPPCTEAMDYYIMQGMLTLSQAQLTAFKTAIGYEAAGGNYRPTQPLNGRSIQGCTEVASWYPYPPASQVPSVWPSLCYTGQKQSPINFESCPAEQRSNRAPVELTWAEQPVRLINNGHTMQLDPQGAIKGQMMIRDKSYTLVQCHFHWGSEHFVNGVQYAMEVHCVHSDDANPGQYGVVGVFYTLGAEDPFLASLMATALPVQPGGRRLAKMATNASFADARRLASAEYTVGFTGPLDVKQLFGSSMDMTKYYSYEGSFTTPPCTEAVTFYIMMNPVTLSQAQLDAFKGAMGWQAAGGNFRPPQPLNGRSVAGCKDSTSPNWYPYPSQTAPNAWPALCYTGLKQSPIDFDTCPSIRQANREAIQITWASQSVQLINTENAVQLNAAAQAPGKMVVQGRSYTLVQCHWHWGSEHTVAGYQYPLEVHCVHTKDGSDPLSYGVFGLFYELGEENAFLEQFIDDLPLSPRRLAEAGSDNTVSSFRGPVDFRGLFGNVDLTTYRDYEGSFTTPPCTEAVEFYIMTGAQTLSQEQLNKFKVAIGWPSVGGNFRPAQPLNGRAVGGCASKDNWYPYPAAYSNSSSWPELCFTGQAQSPVNFDSCLTPETRSAITVTWPTTQTVSLINNGHTVQISATSNPGQMTANGRTYTLSSCHFHWGSEHTVGYDQYPMEVHCVHTEDGSNPQRYGVLGLFYEVGAANAGLEQFIGSIPRLPAGDAVLTSSWTGPMNFRTLFTNADMTKYYNYQGSFTTPPCTEAVDFFILMQPATMSQAQLDVLKAAMGWTLAGGNFRPVQPLNGRQVRGCTTAADMYPYPATDRPNNAWPSVCYQGRKQSPINFEACPTYRRSNRAPIQVSWAVQEISLINSGYAVQLNAAGASPGKMMVGGRSFTLVQCHFHYGSEHFVANVQHVFEVHCVHTEDGTSPQKYGVFGVFYELGNADPFLSTLIGGHLPASPGRRLASNASIWDGRRMASATTSAFTGPVDFTRLYKNIDLTKYYDYEGSFTTPPCTEAVTFFIMMETLTMSQAQLDSFKNAIGWGSAGGNYRPPQPLWDRTVGGCSAEANWYPYSSQSAPNAWPQDICYTGREQSPVNFELCPSYHRINRAHVQIGWGSHSVVLKNTENAIQMDALGTPGKMVIKDKSYTLVQCHWHWGSEHTVSGRQYPLEVHCVHTKDGSPGNYGVFGLFYDLGEENSFLQQFINNLPLSPARRLAGAASDVTVSNFTGPVNFAGLFGSTDLTQYYDYHGSFTTPPCAEVVDFYIMMQPQTLSQAQLDAMKTAIGWAAVGGNYRPAQPLNGREVGGCSSTGNWYPYPVDENAPNAWPALCYHGTQQSPIDFVDCAGASRTPIRVTWGEQQTVELSNNGHTVSIAANVIQAGKMQANGRTYTLIQCHFHWGSEHFIGGVQKPFEVHCVHSEDNSNPPRYGVLGVMYEMGPANPGLEQFIQHLPLSPGRRLADASVSAWRGPLNFTQLFHGVDRSKYYSYQGSFTTPPCTEAADFYVFMDRLTMSQAQMDLLTKAMGWKSAGGNFRPPQPLMGREVTGCLAAEEEPTAGTPSNGPQLEWVIALLGVALSLSHRASWESR